MGFRGLPWVFKYFRRLEEKLISGGLVQRGLEVFEEVSVCFRDASGGFIGVSGKK